MILSVHHPMYQQPIVRHCYPKLCSRLNLILGQIIESLDQLQQQLQLEEALEKELESENDPLLLTKEVSIFFHVYR